MEYPHTKRFVVVWQHHGKTNGSNPPKNGWEEINEFDTIAEARDCANMYLIYYKNDGETKWGMVILDYLKCDFVEWFGDEVIWESGKWFSVKGSKNTPNYERHIKKIAKKRYKLEMQDNFFRKSCEVPENYKWDDGEYDGWLQYRWGDGKNAIDYKSTNKNSSKKHNEIYDEDEEAAWEFYEEPEMKINTLGDVFKDKFFELV